MPRDPHDLLMIQRQFAAALQQPLTGDSRERADLDAGHRQPDPAVLRRAEALLADLPFSSRAEGLETYRGQYWYRLLDSMREDLPALRVVLGERRADALFEAYLLAGPPSSATLRHLPNQFPDFVAKRPELGAIRGLALDVARLEVAECQCFEAADGQPIRSDELFSAEVALAPHVNLLQTEHSILAAYRRWWQPGVWRRLAAQVATPQNLVVFRTNGRITVETIAPRPLAVLRAVADNRSVATALGQLTTAGRLRDKDAGPLQGWFHHWQARGWLVHAQGSERGDDVESPGDSCRSSSAAALRPSAGGG